MVEGFIIPKNINKKKTFVGKYFKTLDVTAGVYKKNTYLICSEDDSLSSLYFEEIDPNTGSVLWVKKQRVGKTILEDLIKRDSWIEINPGESIPNDEEGFQDTYFQVVDNLGILDKVRCKAVGSEWEITTYFDSERDEMFSKIIKAFDKRWIDTEMDGKVLVVTRFVR